MLGTIVNSLAIIVGGIVGVLFKNLIPAKYADSINKASGLAIIAVGIQLMLKGSNMTLMIISVILGTFIGEIIRIEDRLNNVGDYLERKFVKSENDLSAGFVTCTLIFCVGSMAIVGSIQSGLVGNHEILFAKSILDGILSMTMAVTLGAGVCLSAISVFIYQGIITVLAQSLQSVLNDVTVAEMTAVGGILIMAIGFNFLDIKRIKVGNMLPAVFISIVYFMILGLF